MAITITVPADHSISDTGHTTDHNTVVTALTTLGSAALNTTNNLSDVASVQTSMNNLAGAVTAGRYLRGNGTSVTMASIVAGDVPTLNQNTTGTATTALNLNGGATLPDYLAPAVVSLTTAGSGTVNINAALGNDFRQTVNGTALTFGTALSSVDGQRITIQIAQDGTGNRPVFWTTGTAAGFDFGTSGTPTLGTAASGVDVLGFVYNASKTRWLYMGGAFGF